ncbi:integrase catalytic domain-containing protein [Nephila pilipes]|uniref:Integrase catalytic domain-containing protein n=1 Tax=Nephila pilipes TaxID=299642 RepID=A0A8X6MSD4_NEPPI|nr:integrase catalytic domain-containing protein [Nephila pilipes]
MLVLSASDLKWLIQSLYLLIELKMQLDLKWSEYLDLLIQGQRQNPQAWDIRHGDIVLIGDDVKIHLQWSLVRVLELIPGKDGLLRTIKLKTQFSTLIRPNQRVFPLEVNGNDEKSIQFQSQSLRNLQIRICQRVSGNKTTVALVKGTIKIKQLFMKNARNFFQKMFDSFTKFRYGDFIKEKQEVKTTLEHMISHAKTIGYSIKELLYDNCGDYHNKYIQKVLNSKGIIERLITLSVPEQIGGSEKENVIRS